MRAEYLRAGPRTPTYLSTYLPYPPTHLRVAPWSAPFARTSAFESNIPPRIRGMRTFLIVGVAQHLGILRFRLRCRFCEIMKAGRTAGLEVDSRASLTRDSTEPYLREFLRREFGMFFSLFLSRARSRLQRDKLH